MQVSVAVGTFVAARDPLSGRDID